MSLHCIVIVIESRYAHVYFMTKTVALVEHALCKARLQGIYNLVKSGQDFYDEKLILYFDCDQF